MAIPDKPAGQDVPRPVKAVSESTRERETFKSAFLVPAAPTPAPVPV